jgi:hypothetical protein
MSPNSPLPEADELSRTVIDDYVHARWAALTTRFDAVMREKLTEDALASGWAQVDEMVGAYKSHGDPAAKRATDELTYTDTMLFFERGELVCRITFRDDQTIAGLFLLNPKVVAALEE